MMWFLDRMMHRSKCFKGDGNAKPVITETMRASAEVAAKQWNRYQQENVPFENKFIAASSGAEGEANADAKGKALSGMVNADTQQQLAKVSTGINPNTVSTDKVADSVKRARVSGVVDAKQSAIDAKGRQLGAVVALGRGQQTEAIQGLTNLASNSSSVANARMLNDLETDANNRGRIMGNIGSALGAGAYAYSKLPKSPAVDYSKGYENPVNGTSNNFTPIPQYTGPDFLGVKNYSGGDQ